MDSTSVMTSSSLFYGMWTNPNAKHSLKSNVTPMLYENGSSWSNNAASKVYVINMIRNVKIWNDNNIVAFNRITQN